MITKISSLLDYTYPGLSPDVYMQDGTLNLAIRDFVFKLLNSFYESYKLKNPETWVMDVTNIGSLTTNKYIRQSDFDCHVIVDVNKFIETNMPKASKEVALEHLDTARKEWDRAKILLPFGEHALELYFESDLNPSNTEHVGRYSLTQNKWIKEPVFFKQDDDFEESRKNTIEEAKVLANELDSSFGEIKRSIQRIEELIEVAKAWSNDKRKLFYDKIQKKLNIIEEEIEKSLAVKQDLVDIRHKQQDAFSDVELKFKFLSRFHYFAILQDLKDLMSKTEGEVTAEDLPLIEKVISEASLNIKARAENIAWVSPDSKVWPVEGSHLMWIQSHLDVLKKYGIEPLTDASNEDELNDMWDRMLRDGWVRIADDFNEFIIDCYDMMDIPNILEDIILKEQPTMVRVEDLGHDVVLSEEDLSQGLRKAIVKALQQKRLLQTASLDKESNFIKLTDCRYAIEAGVFEDATEMAQAIENNPNGYIPEKDLYFKYNPNTDIHTFYTKVANLKEAFLKEAFEEDKKVLDIDFDQTIAIENSDHTIGEPINGVKEALTKLKQDGFEINIYSHRVSSEGPNEVKEWLEKNQIPYDSILEVSKPLATHYIDDRNIEFHGNWTEVLNKIEKSEKKASLHIVAALGIKYWIDPSGKEYPVDNKLGHYGWIAKNLLHQSGKVTWKSNPDMEQKATEMIQEGWTRITTESDRGADFGIEVANLKRLPAYLDDFIAQRYTGGGIEIDDLGGNYVKVDDPFPSIQKQVNKALHGIAASKKFSKKEVKAQTKKVKQGEFTAIMAVVPHDVAQEIVEWGVRNVPDKVVFSDEENPRLGRELEPHITVKYGLLTDDIKSVRQFFNDEKPFKAKLGKIRHFEPPEMEFDVVTIEVVSEDLERMNKEVTDHFECAEGLVSDEYHPHLTISYVERGKGKDYVGSSEFEGKEIILDTLIVSPRKGNRTYFSIASDKESRFVLEKINKIATRSWYWIDPSGEGFEIGGDTHGQWIARNQDILKKKYGIKFSGKLSLPTDEESAEVGGDVSIPWHDMINKGWIRIGDGASWQGVGIEVKDVRNIPTFVDDYIVGQASSGSIIDLEDESGTFLQIQYPFKSLQQAVNRALSRPAKTASGNNFFPSLVQAPDNKWQFGHGGDDLEIPVDSDPVSDEQTYYAPCTVGKPRNPDMWKQLWHLIKKPLSKKEVESSSDPEQEDVEKKELGENETLLEYSKHFKDLNQQNLNKPKTTWPDNSSSQGGEPYAPLPSFHIETNPQNENWRWPYKFTRRPVGEDSNQGEVTKALEDMFKEERVACIEKITRDITASFEGRGYFISPEGEVFELKEEEGHFDFVRQFYETKALQPEKQLEEMLANGWARIREGDYEVGVEVSDMQNIPVHVQEFLEQYPEDTMIYIDDHQNKHVTLEMEDLVSGLQKVINKALQRKRMGKQASSNVYMLDTASGLQTKVMRDPTPQQAENLLGRCRGQAKQLRYVIDKDGHLYIWDAYDMVHWDVIEQLAIWGDFQEGQNMGVIRSAGEAGELALQVQQNLMKSITAGSYSASVPDYLGNEWGNEQRMDNGGEVNYITKDHVDNGYGFRDFNDSSTDYPKPEDIEPAVVHLDILNKPFNRTDPFGMTWYSVVLYDSAPMSNGIESVNPD